MGLEIHHVQFLSVLFANVALLNPGTKATWKTVKTQVGFYTYTCLGETV